MPPKHLSRSPAKGLVTMSTFHLDGRKRNAWQNACIHNIQGLTKIIINYDE